MAGEESRGKGKRFGCFRVGCKGCAAVILVPLALLLSLTLLRLVARTDPDPEHRQSEQSVPPLPVAARPSTAVPAEPQNQEAQGLQGVEMAPGLGAERLTVEQPGRIVLDIGVADFRIEPGPAGSPISLDANFDRAVFRLKEDMTEHPEGGWTYHLSFGSRGGLLGLLRVREEVEARLVLVVPRDYPIALEGEIGLGESELDLGGLWLTAVDLDIGVGDHRLVFSEPAPSPLGQLSIDSSMGEMSIIDVGNASPRLVEIAHSVGELSLDLDGQWRNDAEIAVDFGLGECSLRLPEDVAVELDKASVRLGERQLRGLLGPEDLPEGAPQLKLTLKGLVGEIRVRQ